MANIKNLKFPDGTVIQTRGNITEFLFHNHPQRVEEWLNHKERFDSQMRMLDTHLKSGKEVKNG
jgi:hypothetical protein